MNWKKEVKKQLVTMANDYLRQAIFGYVPDTINVNLKPMKNFLVGQESRPQLNDIVKVTGGVYIRKQVLEFEDPKYNYPQY